MNVTAIEAMARLEGGLLVSIDGRNWTQLDELALRELMWDWYKIEGSDRLGQFVEHLVGGHTMVSPICDLFRYRTASDAGKQENLF